MPAKWHGSIAYIQGFKTAWVVHNKLQILAAAKIHDLPIELLAGVCWIEVGGDPEIINRIAFDARYSFDWTRQLERPERTSFGQVSMQLRTAAQTLGIDLGEMTVSKWRELAYCLERDVYNIGMAARHLRELIDHDKLPSPLSMDDVRIVGARYNRGKELSLEDIKKDMSYGNFIVNNWIYFRNIIIFGHANGVLPVGARSR